VKRREPLTPDLTPLVDVVFILLIFFIVTSVFKKEELALMLDLPKSQAKMLQVKKEQITIEVNTKSLAYNGKIITFEELDIRLKSIDKKIDNPIIVRIDKNVVYEKVVKVLDLLQQNDLNNLALVTKGDDQ
jgi:biopolymer transport protein ExbD